MPKGHVIGLGRSGAGTIAKTERLVGEDRNTSEILRQQQQELEREGITVDLGHALSWKARIYPSWLLSVLVFLGIHGISPR